MSKSLSSNLGRWMIILFILMCLCQTPVLAETPPGDFDPSNAEGNQLLLRTDSDKLNSLQERYGLQLLDHHPKDVALVTADENTDLGQLTQTLAADADVADVEPVVLASLPRNAGPVQPTQGLWNNLLRSGSVSRRCLSNTQLESMWSGYTDQGALDLVNLPEAQFISPGCGAGVTVAIIDTGVDPDHPALAGALVPGFDFLMGTPGDASEWNVIEDPAEQTLVRDEMQAKATQSVQQILEGHGEIVLLGSSLGIVLDPSVTLSLEGMPLDSYFGHGTMVAGLVRLAAPQASIMPLRVFDDSGSANLYSIVDAVYYAVDNGAHVINMSFSMDTSSRELKRAIKYARNHGVLVVAAAGNEGLQTTVYPAAFPKAIGVASVTDHDQLSEFSNFGPSLVKLAAPGDAVVSAFPGNHYAAGWGTSFSTPLVAGTIALLYPLYDLDQNPQRDHLLLDDLYDGSDYTAVGNLIGKGRLDAFEAFLEALF